MKGIREKGIVFILEGEKQGRNKQKKKIEIGWEKNEDTFAKIFTVETT